MQGRRLPDTPLNQFPIDYDDLQPGDYWLCQTIDGDRLLNVRDHPEDRASGGTRTTPGTTGTSPA